MNDSNQSMYVIYDLKLKTFNVPFFHVNDVQAIRSLQMAMGDKNLQLSYFPEDFELMCIAQYNGEKGEIKPCKPRVVISALAVVAMEKQRQQALNKQLTIENMGGQA